MLKRYALAIVLTLFSVIPSAAGDLNNFAETKERAEQGDEYAQYNLGLMYANGQGVSQNYEQAIKWFTKAAEQGIATAQFNCGLMYATGQGVPQNYKEALKWYTKAAERGVIEAQVNIGSLYANGEGVSKNYTEAFKWYRKAAEQGDEKAQDNLSAMYALGQGVPKNYEQAYIWSSLAAAQSDAPENAAKLRDLVAEKLTPEQLITAQQRATELHQSQEAERKSAVVRALRQKNAQRVIRFSE